VKWAAMTGVKQVVINRPVKLYSPRRRKVRAEQPTSSRRAASTWLWVQSWSDAFAGLSSLSLTVTAGFNDFLSKEPFSEIGGFCSHVGGVLRLSRYFGKLAVRGWIQDLQRALVYGHGAIWLWIKRELWR
jgi:hypothetical protein